MSPSATSRPLTPSWTISWGPIGTSKATSGTPLLSASVITMPKPS